MLRIAVGRCSCTDAQPDPTRQAVCRELMSQLNHLRSKPAAELEKLPPYAETEQVIAGRKVSQAHRREACLLTLLVAPELDIVPWHRSHVC